MSPDDAETHVAANLTRGGFVAERLPTRTGQKTADIRATRGCEVWVIDVKARQRDRSVETRVLAGETVTIAKRADDEPNRFSALERVHKGAFQVMSTKADDELGAVWVVLSDHPTEEMDRYQLQCALLGSSLILRHDCTTTEVWCIHPPQFRGLDVVVIQAKDFVGVMINPEISGDRLKRIRDSHLVRCAPVFDVRYKVEAGDGWMAPSEEEALRLTSDINPPTRLLPREVREWRVEHALQRLYENVGGLMPMRFVAVTTLLPEQT